MSLRRLRDIPGTCPEPGREPDRFGDWEIEATFAGTALLFRRDEILNLNPQCPPRVHEVPHGTPDTTFSNPVPVVPFQHPDPTRPHPPDPQTVLVTD